MPGIHHRAPGPILAALDAGISTFDTAVKVAGTRGRLSGDSPQKLDAARRAVAEHLPTEELLSALEVTRSEVPSSWAMIMASVVLPRPVGPNSSTWSSASPPTPA